MQKRFTATGIESAICKSWEDWEGDTEWLYLYNVELLPEVKAKCIEAGMAPDAKADIDILISELKGSVVTVSNEGEEVFEIPFSLTVTPKFD